MVKYCGVTCQRAHRPQHKVACKKRASDLLDEKLFPREPPPREDCPICFLPLPFEHVQTTFRPCCGKIICHGCAFESDLHQYPVRLPPCAFCRAIAPGTRERSNERVDQRMKVNDAHAIRDRACAYELGEDGFPRDEVKAFELFSRAAKLGLAEAHSNLGNSYKNGRGVVMNLKKSLHLYQLGAIGGDVLSRHNCGVTEAVSGNMPAAMRHFVLGAMSGYDKSMHCLRIGYEQGYVKKEELDRVLHSHHDAIDELKSEQRDMAANSPMLV